MLFFQLHSIDDQIAHTEETIKVAENDAKNADSEVRKAKCEMEKVGCRFSFFFRNKYSSLLFGTHPSSM